MLTTHMCASQSQFMAQEIAEQQAWFHRARIYLFIDRYGDRKCLCHCKLSYTARWAANLSTFFVNTFAK